MGKCCDFFISVICPNKLPEDRRFDLSNTYRVYVLWFFIAAIFLTAGLTHGLGKFHFRKIEPVPDQMYYADWFTNDFCSFVNLTTKWPLRINGYLLKKDSSTKAFCNQSISTKTVAGPTSADISARNIFIMNVFLTEGDRISGQICMSKNEKIYIFTRQMDFLDCVLTDSWTECGLLGPTRYRVESNCHNFENFDSPFILPPQSISSSGNYYFIFYNSLSTSIRVSARFTKIIISEELSQRAERNCQDETLCEFDLGGVSESKAACFEVLRYTPFADREVGKEVEISCKPRLWMYFVLFFILPIIIAIIGSILICTKCNKAESAYAGNITTATSTQRNPPSSYSHRSSPIIYQQNRHSTHIDSQRTRSARSRAVYRDTNLDTMQNEDFSEEVFSNENRSNGRQNFNTSNLNDPPSYDEVMKGVLV